MNGISIKRGASLCLDFEFRRHGSAWDVGYVTLMAQVRAPDDRLVATLPLVKQPSLGFVTADVPDTSDWPVGRLRCDLRASYQGHNVYSETFPIQVARQVTRS